MSAAAMQDQVVDERKPPVIMIDPKIFTLGLTPTEFTVYAALLTFANHNTSQCWPSKERIAKRAGVSKRSADAAIVSLESKKLIEVKDSENTRSKLYTIKDVVKLKRVQNLHGKGAKSAPTEGAKSAPELESVRTITNEQESPPNPREGTDTQPPEPAESKAAQERGGGSDGDSKVIPIKKRDVVFDALAVSLFRVDLNDKAEVEAYSGRVVALKKKLKAMYPKMSDEFMAGEIKAFPEWYHSRPETQNAALPLGLDKFPGYFLKCVRRNNATPAAPAPRHDPNCPHCKGKGYVKINPDNPLSDMKPCACRVQQNGGAK